MRDPNAHCGYCGKAYEPGAAWPRRCASCEQTSWLNPKPVGVLIQPVNGKILLIRRGIEPMKGHLALPGGFMETFGNWREEAARELKEETGLIIDPVGIRLFDMHSTPNNLNLLIFCIGPELVGVDLTTFEPNHECTGLELTSEPVDLAFPLHTKALKSYFDAIRAERLAAIRRHEPRIACSW